MLTKEQRKEVERLLDQYANGFRGVMNARTLDSTFLALENLGAARIKMINYLDTITES